MRVICTNVTISVNSSAISHKGIPHHGVAQTTGPHAHTQLIHLPPSSCKGTAAGRSRTTTSAGWPNDVWRPMVEWPSVGVVFPSSARSL